MRRKISSIPAQLIPVNRKHDAAPHHASSRRTCTEHQSFTGGVFYLFTFLYVSSIRLRGRVVAAVGYGPTTLEDGVCQLSSLWDPSHSAGTESHVLITFIFGLAK